MTFPSPLRYPGGKKKLTGFIKDAIVCNDLQGGVYVEPFAGGASIAWYLLFNEYVSSIIINDLDKSIYAFWFSVLNETDKLCKLIRDTPITVEEWETQRLVQNDKDNTDYLTLGFSTFFLNRTNRSGIIKGGIIGGKDQSGKWKMDVRFNNQQEIYNTLFAAVDDGLHERELIPEVTLDDIKIPEEPKESKKDLPKKSEAEHTEKLRTSLQSPQNEDEKLQYFMNEMKKRVYSYHEALHENKQETTPALSNTDSCKPQKDIPVQDSYKTQKNIPVQNSYKPQRNVQAQGSQIAESPNYTAKQVPAEKPQQLNFFEEKLLEPQAKAEHKIIGQVFDTYWLVEFHDNLYIIDQHAAHERVLYEQTLKGMKTREFTSQLISPPIVLNLSMQEAELLRLYMDQFTRIGFEIEEFGQDSYAVRAVPDNLFSIAKKELLMEMIDSLSDEINRNAPSNLIDEKIASMSCKAAVKGNMRLSAAEVDTLITELLSLDNPYHCPHGRPTIIAMSRRELEKKFKRIV